MSKLDHILRNFAILVVHGYGAKEDTEPTKEEIKAIMLELIGEDEQGGYARGVQPVRNRLRAELRKKVELL